MFASIVDRRTQAEDRGVMRRLSPDGQADAVGTGVDDKYCASG